MRLDASVALPFWDALDVGARLQNASTTSQLQTVIGAVTDDIIQGAGVFDDLPADDPSRRQPDISLLSEITGGFEPRVDLRAGLTRTAEWLAGELEQV